MLHRRRIAVSAIATGALLAAGLSGAAQAEQLAVFDVTAFGATGNGVTDDSDAFRDAIAAADAAAGTNTVLVPAGTYVLDRSVNTSVGIIRMVGVTNVDVVGVGATSIVKWKPRNWSTGSDPHLFWCDSCSFVSFSNLSVDGADGEAGFSGQEQMHALFFRNSSDVSVHDVTFTDTFGDGVAVIGDGGITEDVTVADNTFVSSGRSGIGVQGGTRRMEFTGNEFQSTSDQDIDFEPTGSAEGRPGPEDVLIQNNTFVRNPSVACKPPVPPDTTQDCTIAVTIGGQFDTNKAERVQFLDNQLTDSAIRVFQTDDVTIEGNTSTSDIVQDTPVLNVVGQNTGTVIRDNTFESTNAGKSVIEIGPSNNSLPGDMLIEQNRIRQLSSGDGIFVARATGPVVIQDNDEITGVGGTGRGVNYDLTVSDGILRTGTVVSGNTIDGFGTAAVQLHTTGTAAFGTVTVCGNTIADSPNGIRFLLASASTLGEAVICNNTYTTVTSKVSSDQVTDFRGTGSPQTVVAAPVGSEFIRTDEANRLYLKQSGGSGSTGWVGQ